MGHIQVQVNCLLLRLKTKLEVLDAVVWCAAIQLICSCTLSIYAHSKHDRAVFGVQSHFSSCTCLSLQIYLMSWLPFMQNSNTLHGHFFLSSWFISWFVTAFLSEAEQRTGSQTEQSSFLGLIQSFIVRNSSWQPDSVAHSTCVCETL